MKRIFTIIALVAISMFAMAQTNQLVWSNGRLIYGTSIETIDSLTYGEMEDIDTLHLLLPRTLIKVVHDTVYVHDTIYIDAPKPEDPEGKYTKVLGSAVLGDNVEIKGYIAALSAQGPILNDAGGSILLYKTTGVEIGDEVTVSGTISSYNKGFQIASAVVEKTGSTTVTYPEPMELTGAKMDELLTTRTEDEYAYYAKMSGTVSVSGYYFNFNVPGAESAVGSVYGATEEVKATLADGMECTLYGYFCSISAGKYINLIVTSIEPMNTESTDTTYEYVDLGLPSGLKWATCNVGANAPEEYGDYFAWGEVKPKTTYNLDTYKYYDGSNFTKYTGSDKTVLDPEDDAAYVNWGGAWRMPTKAEQDELRKKCTWAWTTQNGVKGYKVTGPNGNSIFLPAAGFMDEGTLSYAGSVGTYWFSLLYTDDPYLAYNVYFDSDEDDVDWSLNPRYSGFPVRPVCK